MNFPGPESAFVLRAVRAGDIAELAALLPEVLSGDWTETALQRLLGSTHMLRVLTVAVDGVNPIAGFVECQQILDEAHLLNIAVATRWQGKGIGSALLAELLAELAALGCTRCLLEVRRSNTAALRLYERAGFSLDGVRTGYYPALPSADARTGRDHSLREDALLYSRVLGPSS